ncbi:MAG: hypothetical protein KDD55_11575, partial [Bdellovibrionales bacterium]|nr:hypothetical protein [Bdellovibrionales bacterium]
MKITSCVIFFFIACGVVGNAYALPIPQPTPPPPGYEVPEFGPPDIIYEPEGEPTPPPELWQKAEEPNITQAPDITTEQVAAFLATKFGIPPKSKITHRFHDLILNYKTGTEIARKKSKIITKSGVYRHFRFGKGILFPSEDELKPIAPTQEEKKAILESIVEGQKKLKAKLQKPAYKQSPGQERRSADLM